MAENRFGFQFKNIDIVYKAVAPRPVDFQGGEFSFDINAEASIRTEEQQIFVFVKINVRDAQKPQVLATFTIVNIFQIFNFAEAVTQNEHGLFVIDTELDRYLKSAAISTLRGVIWSELKGSYLHFAVLPVIDVVSLKNVPERHILSENGELLQKEIH
jgi:hypothetical protein